MGNRPFAERIKEHQQLVAEVARLQTELDRARPAALAALPATYGYASMESFWSTLKHELVYRHRFATRDEATTAIFDYIESFYNRTRLHSALGFKSSLAYESNLN